MAAFSHMQQDVRGRYQYELEFIIKTETKYKGLGNS